MIERRIAQTKEFMRSLLMTEAWDDWLMTQAVITGAATWTIDGSVNRAYYDEDAEDLPETAYMPWGQMRPAVLSLIRGKRTPVSFRFLMMPSAQPVNGIDRICRIRFEQGQLYVASAVSIKDFLPDKEPERTWDADLSRFLDTLGLAYEEL